ncbi:MAG: hypothetical protein HYR62_05460 [Actinobacteria bacterium]|nr:hypothetical protein [Actinomycetota bacterium]MBI3688489.1 hypothetical protein [Actinomycetota bacterium]
MALSDLTRHGIIVPAWAARLGHATAGRAWRYRDVFGDQELVLVSFRYDSTEHAILVETAACPSAQVRRAHLSVTVEELRRRIEAATDADGNPMSLEEIPLQRAHAVLDGALGRPHPDCEPETLTWLPIVRDRMSALPEAQPHERMAFTDADREAAVQAFLADTEPSAGTRPDVLAFWARVLTGYTAITDSPPTRVGPVWLGPAVIAWTAWAAQQERLPPGAAARLAARVAEIEPTFDRTYDDPDAAAARSYLTDVAAAVANARDLERTRSLRAHAVPTPDQRPPETRTLHAGDPEHRRRILSEELRRWQLGPDLSEHAWSDALTRVSDQLWHQDPPDLGEAARRYLDREGADPDLLGDLTELAVDHHDDEAERFLPRPVPGSRTPKDYERPGQRPGRSAVEALSAYSNTAQL